MHAGWCLARSGINVFIRQAVLLTVPSCVAWRYFLRGSSPPRRQLLVCGLLWTIPAALVLPSQLAKGSCAQGCYRVCARPISSLWSLALQVAEHCGYCTAVHFAGCANHRQRDRLVLLIIYPVSSRDPA